MDHQLVQDGKSPRCTVCGWTWTRQPQTDCPGVPRYAWGAWGENLLTKKQMSEAGFQTGKKLPSPAGAVARSDSPGGWMWLYDRAQGVPKKQITDAQREVLKKAAEKARIGWSCQRCGGSIPHYVAGGGQCDYCRQLERIEVDHDEAAAWAREALATGEALILDTETTGLDSGYNEVIQLAVIDLAGNVLLDTLIQAQHPERMFEGDGRCAHDVHKISPDDLATAPTFPEIYPRLCELVSGRQVLIYNEELDSSMLQGMCRRYGLTPLDTQAWDCLMHWYAAWVGDWSDYWGNYRWQSLNGGHTALSDCLAALAVLKQMSKQHEPDPAE